MNDVLFETDWLASEPVYYNEVSGQASWNMNDVIDLQNMEIDHTGLAAYLDHGFSVFQRTPVKHVRAMPPSSRLFRGPAGTLRVERLPDGVDQRLDRPATEADVIDLVRSRVRNAERTTSGAIVIPTSGGYDSRLLNLMVGDTSRVRSFTYGTSEPQEDSLEIHRAQALAKKLGTRWEAVPIGLFHMYFDAWDRLFGPAVHAHGMYQMEFYDHVIRRVGAGNVVLSGIAGDWFSGKGDPFTQPILSPGDVRRSIFSLVMHADSTMARVGANEDLYEEYFETHRDLLVSWERRLIQMVRFRMMLLHYLTRVPRELGFDTVSPFIDIEVATAMLGLPVERRSNRHWQAQLFERRGVGFERVTGASRNTLNLQAMRLVPLKPLDEVLLREVVRTEYVRWINRNAGWRGLWWEGYGRLLHVRGISHARPYLKRWGLMPRRLDAYSAYLILKPIESLLRRRDEARRGVSQRGA